MEELGWDMFKLLNIICLFFLLLIMSCGQTIPSYSNSREAFLISQGAIRHFPFVYNGTKRKFIMYSTHPDAVLPEPLFDEISILNGPTIRNSNFYISGMTELNGVLLGTSYITKSLTNTTEQIFVWRSDDIGSSWNLINSTMQFPQSLKVREAGWGGFLFHRRLHKTSKNEIVGTMYGNYDSDIFYRTLWVKSNDEGKTWNIVSTVANGEAGSEGYGEPVSVICNNKIIVIIRTGANTPLRQVSSSDDGITWNSIQVTNMIGWDPDLESDLSTGSIILSYGVPGKITVMKSNDCGTSWLPLDELIIPTTSGYSGILSWNNNYYIVTDTSNETEIKAFKINSP